MALTNTEIRNTKATSKAFKLYDEAGLFLQIAPNGGKWWRFKYRFEGKEKLLSFGTYPEVTLADARERRDQARKLLAQNPPIDPSAKRKAIKAARLERASNSFEVIARMWLTKYAPKLSPVTAHPNTVSGLQKCKPLFIWPFFLIDAIHVFFGDVQ